MREFGSSTIEVGDFMKALNTPPAAPLPLTPASQKSLIERLYAEAPMLVRLKQSWRPYFAPFADLMEAVPAGSEIMDIGCGGALFLLMLAASGRIRRGFGFDASQRNIDGACQAAIGSRLQKVLTFQHRTVQEGLPRRRWRVVSLIDVLHHIPPSLHRSFVQSLPQAVARGGRLIIRDPVRRPYWRNLANGLHDLLLARQIVFARDPEEVEDWLADSGLRLADKRRTNVLWYGYWMLVYERPA